MATLFFDAHLRCFGNLLHASRFKAPPWHELSLKSLIDDMDHTLYFAATNGKDSYAKGRNTI
jgi:hypothetical protein